jgi:hypothetical protein
MKASDYRGFYGKHPGLFFIIIFLLGLLMAQVLHWLEG